MTEPIPENVMERIVNKLMEVPEILEESIDWMRSRGIELLTYVNKNEIVYFVKDNPDILEKIHESYTTEHVIDMLVSNDESGVKEWITDHCEVTVEDYTVNLH